MQSFGTKLTGTFGGTPINTLIANGVGLGLGSLAGDAYWVDSTSAVGRDSPGHGTREQPYLTIAYALSVMAADDVLFVKPRHAETIAGTAALSTADLNIIGLGSGTSRPMLTFASVTGANLNVTGANASICNLAFQCNIASLSNVINVAAQWCRFDNCYFVEGTHAPLNWITFGTGSGYGAVRGCRIHAPTVAAAAGNGILVSATVAGVQITDNDVLINIGAPDASHSPICASVAATDMYVARNSIVNKGTTALRGGMTFHANATGRLERNWVTTGAAWNGTDDVISVGGLRPIENYVTDADGTSGKLDPPAHA